MEKQWLATEMTRDRSSGIGDDESRNAKNLGYKRRKESNVVAARKKEYGEG